MKDESKRVVKESAKAQDADPTLPSGPPAGTLEWLYAQAHAGRWGLSRETFAAALERCVKKRLSAGPLSPEQLKEYWGALHLEDLALAVACAENCEAAWEYFVATYRGYLRAGAAAILRSSAGSAEASELADSLFSDLYGLDGSKRGERSLFRYFHGRSSLKTWLRPVLAQRHIDGLRANRRFEELRDDETGEENPTPQSGPLTPPPDPHRERYIELFRRALALALDGLSQQDSDRLRLYYAEEKTLAECGRTIGEHESSVSRNLDRIRRELRSTVEELLRCGSPLDAGFTPEPGLSDAEIALCVEYAAADAPIDLDKLFAQRKTQTPAPGRQES
jgi:RNA polymerase sigma factor (sigma-70 family)